MTVASQKDGRNHSHWNGRGPNEAIKGTGARGEGTAARDPQPGPERGASAGGVASIKSPTHLQGKRAKVNAQQLSPRCHHIGTLPRVHAGSTIPNADMGRGRRSLGGAAEWLPVGETP
ncbi:unnamed protein product [Ixodes hexagonus]